MLPAFPMNPGMFQLQPLWPRPFMSYAGIRRKGACYKEKADKIMESLGSTYASAPGENYGFILGHSVGAKPMDSEVDVPLNYADYYYLEALLRKKNLEEN